MLTFGRSARVLIVAPHADDAELGCPALLQMTNASVLLLSGDGTRRIEAKSAATVYGAELLTAEFNDGGMYPSSEMVRRIESAISQTGSTAIFCPPSIDEHQDHRAAAAACVSATRRSMLTLAEYETPSTPPEWAPTLFLPWQRDTLPMQSLALSEYRTQAHRSYLGESQRAARSVFRAARIGGLSADAFRLVRLAIAPSQTGA